LEEKKTKKTIPELKEFARKHNLEFPENIRIKQPLIDIILKNVDQEIANSFLYPPTIKKVKQKKVTINESESQTNTGTISNLDLRLTTLEGQVRELIDQFKDLRNMVVNNIDNESQLSVQQVYQTARTLSNSYLMPLDKLRNELNPSKDKKIDKQLQECLKYLMEEGKIHLQEMKSEFQIQIRTDTFGGFKVLSI